MFRAGIIGLGTLGTRYIKLIGQEARAELVGVFDVSAERREEVAKTASVPAYDSAAAMFDEARLDFVYVGTPDFAHRDHVIEAAQHGVNILVEKPLATSVADAEAMVNAVRKAGVKAQIAFSNRYNPPFVAAKRLIDAGDIGSVVSINTRLNDSVYVPTTMLRWAAQSSPAWFLMSHTMDVASWLTCQEVETVYATGVKKVLMERGIDTYDSLQAAVTYSDGAQGFFESNWVLPDGIPIVFDFRFELVGTKGMISIDTHDQMLHFVADRYRHLGTMDMEVNGRLLGQTAFTFQAFMDALEAGESPSPDLEDGLANVRALEAVHRSAGTHEVVRL